MQNLLKDKFIFGVDAAGSAGPVGRNAAAETDATAHAEILTYAKSKGLFAGVSLKGSTLRPDGEANGGLYGKKVDAKELLMDGSVAVPEDAVKFINALTKATTN